MSEEHVAAVFGPPWVREGREREQAALRMAERKVLALRLLLRAADPGLPDPYNGPAWHPIEEAAL